MEQHEKVWQMKRAQGKSVILPELAIESKGVEKSVEDVNSGNGG
jgi:hypothetical protein